jgi:hypothetical protein
MIVRSLLVESLKNLRVNQRTFNEEDFKMKRIALFVVAAVFALSTLAIAADKPAVAPAAAPEVTAAPADAKADVKKAEKKVVKKHKKVKKAAKKADKEAAPVATDAPAK